jgi:E3 ubiquitin-protein ligase SHPRH
VSDTLHLLPESYFRQLQEISDSVIEAEEEESLADALIDSKAAIDGLGIKINSLQSHQRYLDNLSGTKVTGEEDDTCIVCRFVTGICYSPKFSVFTPW